MLCDVPFPASMKVLGMSTSVGLDHRTERHSIPNLSIFCLISYAMLGFGIA